MLIVFNVCDVQAINQDLQFQHFTIQDGLSEAFVTSMSQDSTGFIWIGTYDGLNRFDGQSFEIYRNIPGDTNSLQGNMIYAVFHDSQHRLWVGTSHGLSYYNPNCGSFIRINCFNSFLDFGVTTIDEDLDGHLWVGSTSHGVFKLNKDLSTYQNYNGDKLSGISSNSIQCILVDSENKLWIGTKLRGLNVLNIEDGSIKQFFHNPKDSNSLAHSYVSDIVEDSNKTIWVSTQEGLNRIVYGVSGHTQIERIYGQIKSLASNSISGLHIDRKGVLWLSGQNGLGRYDMHTDSFRIYQHDILDPSSLASNNPKDIFEDREGNLLVAIIGHGFDFYSPKNNRFNHIKPSRDFGLSVGSNAVTGFYPFDENKLWVCSDGGGIFGYDLEKHSYFPNLWGSYSDSINMADVIFSCTQDSKGNFWISSYMGGVYKVNDSLKTIRQYKHKPKDSTSLRFDDVRYVFEDDEQNIWVLTNGGGINIYNEEEDHFTHFGMKDGLISESILCAIQDQNDNIWIGTYNGLSIFNTKDKTIENFSSTPESNPQLLYEWVYALLEDSKGRVWIGTANGLNIMHKQTGYFKSLTTADGLSNNVINGLFEDKKGNIWASTNRGLSKINESTLNIVNYNKFDGLQSNQFNHGSVAKVNNGMVCFGGIDGFNAFNPDNIIEDNDELLVSLTNLYVNYKKVIVGDHSSVLDKHISQTDKITLNHNQTVVTIEYIVPSYSGSSINYACYLEGFDKGWNNVGSERKITYMNLPAGRYKFHVKALNRQGDWSEKVTTVSLQVLTPFWKTWIFRVLLTLVVGLILFMIYQLRINRLKRKEKSLTQLVDKRTGELQKANERLKDRQEEVEVQNEELTERSEIIYSQNTQLEKMKNSLEEKVQQRTKALREAKDKAEESDRLKLTFLANMSHEIRTPMNGIIGFSSLLHDDEVSKKERTSYLNHIDGCTNDLLALLTDIIDIAKIEANSLKLEHKEFDLILLMNELYGQFSLALNDRAKEQVVFFNLQNLEGVFLINSDRNRIKQIIGNLLSNAIKFTAKGSIDLALVRTSNSFTIIVKDTGIGISDKYKEIIFERFRQVDDYKEFSKGGTGLGLTISKGLVDQLGGELVMESTVGVGSEFKVVFPLSM